MVNGKEKAFNEIYNRYSKPLFLFFYRRLYQENSKAQDFLQDLFLKLIEKAETFDSSKKFSTWIYTIAYNMCKNEYRANAQKEAKTVRLDGNQANIQIAQPLADKIEQDTFLFKKRLDNELKKLNENQRTTFLLRYQNNLSIKEIGEIMNCSQGTVKSRLHHALKKLSLKLEKFNPKNL